MSKSSRIKANQFNSICWTVWNGVSWTIHKIDSKICIKVNEKQFSIKLFPLDLRPNSALVYLQKANWHFGTSKVYFVVYCKWPTAMITNSGRRLKIDFQYRSLSSLWNWILLHFGVHTQNSAYTHTHAHWKMERTVWSAVARHENANTPKKRFAWLLEKGNVPWMFWFFQSSGRVSRVNCVRCRYRIVQHSIVGFFPLLGVVVVVVVVGGIIVKFQFQCVLSKFRQPTRTNLVCFRCAQSSVVC